MISLLREKRRLLTKQSKYVGRTYSKDSTANIVTTDAILEAVCSHLNLDIDKVKGEYQGERLVKARAIFSYIGREKGFPCKELGRAINRDHASVLYHAKRYKDVLDTEKPWFDEKLHREIKEVVNIL